MAKAYALTTTSRFKTFAGISGSAHDTLIDDLIDIATEMIERYCDRRFQQTVYSNEQYDGTGTDLLLLDNYPVDSSATFTLQERTTRQNKDDWSTVETEDYFVDWDEGIVHFNLGFIEGKKLYRVSYTAGYDFDNSSTFLGDTEAGDLEYVVWKLVKTAYDRRRGTLGIQSEAIGDYKVTYQKSIFEDPEIRGTLDRYKRAWL